LKIVIIIALSALITFSPFILAFLWSWLEDLMARRRAAAANRHDYDELMKRANHRSTLMGQLRAAMQDKRLVGLMRKVMVPKQDDQGNPVDRKGDPVDDPSQAVMVPAKDDDGKVIKEYRFDKFTDEYCNPHLEQKNPLPVDPGPRIPAWVTCYKLGFLGSFMLAFLVIAIGFLAGLVIPFIESSVVFGVMRRQGQACLDSDKQTWDKINTIYTKYFGQPPEGATVHDMVQIIGWEAPGESQAIADAIVYASEIGKDEEAEAIIHPKDKRGHEKRPRIARFRNVPSAMVIRFGANFMRESINAFMNHLNQTIGGGTVEWVARSDVNKNGHIVQKDGWDFDKQEVWLKTMPPLPMMASLPEDLDETPWNVIRIGRSVSGEATWDLSGQGWGAKMERDENGQLHPVMGKDGKPLPDDKHQSEQAGITTPMSLIPLDVDTMVWTLVPVDDDGDEIENSNASVITDDHDAGEESSALYTN
jgi:hypothetical protein